MDLYCATKVSQEKKENSMKRKREERLERKEKNLTGSKTGRREKDRNRNQKFWNGMSNPPSLGWIKKIIQARKCPVPPPVGEKLNLNGETSTERRSLNRNEKLEQE